VLPQVSAPVIKLTAIRKKKVLLPKSLLTRDIPLTTAEAREGKFLLMADAKQVTQRSNAASGNKRNLFRLYPQKNGKPRSSEMRMRAQGGMGTLAIHSTTAIFAV
jgi:hypothetical protein